VTERGSVVQELGVQELGVQEVAVGAGRRGQRVVGAALDDPPAVQDDDLVGVAEGGEAGIVVGVTEDLTGKFDAVALVRAASERLGGKGGGGRRDLAQAGGPDGSKAAEALAAIESMVAGA